MNVIIKNEFPPKHAVRVAHIGTWKKNAGSVTIPPAVLGFPVWLHEFIPADDERYKVDEISGFKIAQVSTEKSTWCCQVKFIDKSLIYEKFLNHIKHLKRLPSEKVLQAFKEAKTPAGLHLYLTKLAFPQTKLASPIFSEIPKFKNCLEILLNAYPEAIRFIIHNSEIIKISHIDQAWNFQNGISLSKKELIEIIICTFKELKRFEQDPLHYVIPQGIYTTFDTPSYIVLSVLLGIKDYISGLQMQRYIKEGIYSSNFIKISKAFSKQNETVCIYPPIVWKNIGDQYRFSGVS